MRIGDHVTAIVSMVEVATGTIIGMETNAAIVSFPSHRPFSIPESQMIPVRPNTWRVFFNAKSDLAEGKI